MMHTVHLDKLKYNLLKALENTLPGQVSFAYLFGSQATGQARPDSDIDLALFPEPNIPPEDIWNAAQSLASQLNCDIDLINLREANTVLRFQIVSEGKLLFDKHNQAPGFEVDTFRMYQDLQYNRKDNINGLLERWNEQEEING